MNSAPILFDVNASVGQPCTGTGECPTIANRLENMNRMGISRALVWNQEAKAGHSLTANRSLLDEIAHTSEATERIIPALVFSGMIAYEHEGIATLRRQMEAGRTRALRFVNINQSLTLRQCQPVVDAVRALKPFILVSCAEAETDDLLEFTQMFSDVPVVLTDVMWRDCLNVFDLMRLRPNVLLETSWLHTWGCVNLAVKHFGAERVLFGTGYLSHNGAAIATLTRADITKGQRESIAHGNADQLLDLQAENLAPPSGLSRKTLWNRCLSGEPLGVDIVDAHGHLGGIGSWVLEYSEEGQQISDAIRVMDTLGQKTMIISGHQSVLGPPVRGNDLVRDLLRPYADRFLIYLGYNPHYAKELVPLFDQYFADAQFIGLKVVASYQQVKITDERYNPMWEYANRHRLPVLIHTWTGTLDSPAMLRDIAKQYPDASLIVGHSGGSDVGRREAIELAAEVPNAYLEWCGSFCSMIPWERTLQEVSPDRVVYGTDAMCHDIHWELGRLLSLDIPDEIIIPILGQNMRRILARCQ